MAQTLIQLRTKLRDWLSVTSSRLPDAYATDLINQACREIYMNYDLRFGEKAAVSGAFVAGTQAYALPANFSRPVMIRTVDNGDYTKWNTLNQLSYDDFTAKYAFAASATSGDPLDFTIYGDSASPLLFGPTPSRVLQYYVDYYAIPAELAADGDTNTLTINAYQPVLYRALSLASKFMLEDERSAVFDQEFQKEMRNLLTEQNRSRWSGMASPQMIEPM